MTSTRKTWKGVPVLYRCYDSDRRLIYVGSTISMWDRIGTHRFDSWWLPLLAKLRMQVFPTIESARQAEREAIADEAPAFNMRHYGGSALGRSWDEMYASLTDSDREQWQRWVERDRCSSWPLPGWMGRHLSVVAA